MNLFSTLSIAFLGGFLPALFWLWFWLHEDNLHPEPRRRLMLCFLAGMLAVPLVFPFEKIVRDYFGDSRFTILLWAFIEESFKFAAAYTVALSKRENDEPIDALIYMITAALGFSALENTFFLLTSLDGGVITHALMTGTMRFIGASLLHVVASASIGIFMAFGYYRLRFLRFLGIAAGLCVATTLHTVFNLSIISNSGTTILAAFYSVWIAVVVLFLAFEKVKRITSPLT